MTTEKKDYTLSSVKNALRILRRFSMEESELKITDLAKDLDLGKSTVSRLMSTLASEGFVEKNPDNQRYRLGLSILSLASVCTSNFEIHKEAMPVLHSLVEKTGETSHLAILDGLDVIYLHKVESKHHVRAFTHIGKRNPAYATSSGKIMLAYNEEQFVDRTVERGFEQFTNNTITNRSQLLKALKEVRTKGYALSIEEIFEGVVSIAAPVRDYTGQVIASVNIVGPMQRLNERTIPVHTKKVVEAGKQISERLGYRSF
ncbi:IclR family transcriptional regulator [Alkalihalobacillus sp. MEB130]|uniref:IclR family transcriptional regulator n=1 Tax=Alkalihalobacillus sp. MEB130 TaxID=2976704 RepID=UPI0028E09C9A|nr:IclR family transcriptional regulator [Alkalihalobacillus sp. MEB130]MDT8859696.1 IclR family transcriptional regulator [Alkalihalobacillus sp. MEB130]